MKPSRISALHVHIGGAVIVLVVFLILFFGMIRPKNQDTEIQKGAADAAVTGGGTQEANMSSAADLVKSKKQTVQIERDWAVYDRKYMPDLKWDSNLLQAYYFSNQINEIPIKWGKWVTAWYDAQKHDGITRSPGVEFPIPPLASDPNGIASLTSITFPSPKSPWKVSLICQTFDDAMAHLRRFNGMLSHGMPVVDGVTLSGHSPQLTLNYNLSLYVIPGTAPPPPDTRIGAGGGGGGGAAGFGGMGGGMGNSNGGKMPGMMSGPGGGGGGNSAGAPGGPGSAKGVK